MKNKTHLISIGIFVLIALATLIVIEVLYNLHESNGNSLEHICTETESTTYACTKEYHPVCGKLILNTGKSFFQTFGNGCMACSAMKVVSYVPGECSNQSQQGQRDASGCLTLEGYSWNESEKECVREEEVGTQRYQVTDYQTCADTGYPIMESYPEQCRTPSGRTFSNTPGKKPAIPYEEFDTKIVYSSSETYTLDDYKNDCTARSGVFNECGSPCAPDAEACVMMCVFTCENIPKTQ